MAEYIERDVAKDELLSWAVCIKHPEHLMKEDAMHILDSIPAADVAPVVRCKDCKHGDAFDGNAVVIWCPYYEDQPVDPDHFCGYGERKDGAADKNVGHAIPVNDLYDEDGSEVTADG